MTNKNKTKEQLIPEVKLLRDEIKETKKVVKALKESEEKYRNLVDLAPESIATVDLKGIITSVNKAYLQMTGYEKEEIVGKHFTKLSGPRVKDIPRFVKIFTAIMKGETPEPFEIKWVHKDGSLLDTEVHITHTRIGGKISGLLAVTRDITERKKSEKELKRSDTNFRNIYNLTSDAIFIKDKNLKILEVNKAAEKLFGFTREELLARPEKTLGDKKKNDYKLADKYVKEALKGIPQRFEWWGLKKDGTSFPEDMLINKTVYNGKDVLLFTIRDITEYKRAEKAQSESEKRFRVLFENTPLGYQSLDRDGNIVEINQSWLDLLGYSRDEVMGKFFGDFLNPVSRNSFIEKFAEFKAAGSVQGAEFEALRKDGSKLIISINGKIGYDEQGKFKQTYCILNDITERQLSEEVSRRAEEARRRTQENLNNLFRYTTDAIFIQNLKREILDCNAAAKELFGYSREELVADPTIKLGDQEKTDEDQREEYLQRAIQGQPQRFEWWGKRKDGTSFPEEIILNRTVYNGEEVVFATIRDITERRQAEEKIQKSLQEKEILLKEIHHRVKNNLQVISSLLNLQSEDFKDPSVRALFNESRDRIRSMALVHESLYRSEDYSQVNFGEYLEKLTGQLFRLYQKEAAPVALDLKVASYKLSMDLAIPCGIVVNELVTNALKHAFPQGREGKITVSLRKKNRRHLELIVQDNGVGLPEQTERAKTTSLGMNLISILVKDQLKGTLEIEREGGTLVRIQFHI